MSPPGRSLLRRALSESSISRHCPRLRLRQRRQGVEVSSTGGQSDVYGPPMAKATFTLRLWPMGHTLGSSTLVAWRAADYVPSSPKIKDGSSLDGAFRGEVPGLAASPAEKDPLMSRTSVGFGGSGKWLFAAAAAVGLWDSIFDVRPLLSRSSSSRPSIGNLSSYFRRLWIRFILGNHAAEDQWLMNIHEKIHSVWLYLPTGMKYGLLCERFSLDQKDLWRTYCTEYVLN